MVDNTNTVILYLTCQGWLDILINHKSSSSANKEKYVYAQLNDQDILKLFKKTSEFLMKFLNKGSFDGVTGSCQDLMMKLNIANDLVHILRNAYNSTYTDYLAISEMFKMKQASEQQIEDLQASFNLLLTWLFLNGRLNRDSQTMSALGNTTTLTPATRIISKITEVVEEVFQIISQDKDNQATIKIALASLMNIVKQINLNINELVQLNQLGYDCSMKYSLKSNEYFTKFLKQWLINDNVASYFIFDLGGFEFLLDTIGIISDDNPVQIQEFVEEEQSDKIEVQTELHTFLGQLILGKNKPEKQSEEKNSENKGENPSYLQLQEFSKQLAMDSNNAGDPVSSHQKTDWSVNKRGYKHRIMIKNLSNNQLKNEYNFTFSLPFNIELKEVQIGFNNFWSSSDSDLFAEPLSVTIEAGLQKDNMNLICSLHVIKDDGFGSVSATVFGKNLHTFNLGQSEIGTKISDIVQNCLSSLNNSTIRYIKFCLRRFTIQCIENSPMAVRFNKQVSFGINYISILGYDCKKIGEYSKQVAQEQKKAALEVLSIICQGDFHKILRVIANEPKTIEKIKKSFNLLVSLIQVKKNLIEPTFIAISTFNIEMGDWIIKQFLRNCSELSHAALVGELILCSKSEIQRRIKIIQEFVFDELLKVADSDRSIHQPQIQKNIPLIKIFIQCMRIAGPALDPSIPVELDISESIIQKIISILSNATPERNAQTKVLIQLLLLAIYPPAPFVNSQVKPFNIVLKTIEETTLQDGILPKNGLISNMAASSIQISSYLYDQKYLLQPILSADTFIREEPEKLIESLQFWIKIIHLKHIQENLIKENIPLLLYQSMINDNPLEKESLLIQNEKIQVTDIELMIEFIKMIVAGNDELEQKLSVKLIEDVNNLSHIKDMNYVNKVFLALLKVEKTIPICLSSFDKEYLKVLPHYKPQIQEQQKQNNTDKLKLQMQSQILSGELKNIFYNNFKEVINTHQKSNAKKILEQQWELCYQQNSTPLISQFNGMWLATQLKQPLLILASTSQGSNEHLVYGCYCANGLPEMPQSPPQDTDFIVKTCPEDFCFAYIDDKNVYHYKPKPSNNILTLYTDYEGGGAISIAGDFILISYSYDFSQTFGDLHDIELIHQKINPNPTKSIVTSNQNFKQLEIWTLPSKSEEQAEKTGNNLLQGNMRSYGSYQQYFDHLLQSKFEHTFFNEEASFNNFRANPVFLIPSHLSLYEVGNLLIKSSIVFTTNIQQQIQEDSKVSIQEKYDSLTQNKTLFESSNAVLDLFYDIQQLMDQKIEGSIDKTNNEGYVPKMGIFQKFEEQEGVKKMIEVTLQSINLWKNKDSAKSWELWLKELQSLSQIPLFFQLFMKNTQCKDLLFKILARQPEIDILAAGASADAVKKKWEEEQKQAVQFNYKILSETFSISTDQKIRKIALESGLLDIILERLGKIADEKPREFVDDKEEKKDKDEEEEKVQIKTNEVAEKNTDKKKRKGVGYSSKVGQTFNVNEYLENKKVKNTQIKNLVDILTNFFDAEDWDSTVDVMEIILQSPLLPLLENSFRSSSWLDMAKEHEVYHSYMKLTRTLASQQALVSCLVQIDSRYKPVQTESIQELLKKLSGLANIFLSCLSQQNKSEHPNLNSSQNQVKSMKSDPHLNQNNDEEVLQLLQKSYQSFNQIQMSELHTLPFINPLEEQKELPSLKMKLKPTYNMKKSALFPKLQSSSPSNSLSEHSIVYSLELYKKKSFKNQVQQQINDAKETIMPPIKLDIPTNSQADKLKIELNSSENSYDSEQNSQKQKIKTKIKKKKQILADYSEKNSDSQSYHSSLLQSVGAKKKKLNPPKIQSEYDSESGKMNFQSEKDDEEESEGENSNNEDSEKNSSAWNEEDWEDVSQEEEIKGDQVIDSNIKQPNLQKCQESYSECKQEKKLSDKSMKKKKEKHFDHSYNSEYMNDKKGSQSSSYESCQSEESKEKSKSMSGSSGSQSASKQYDSEEGSDSIGSSEEIMSEYSGRSPKRDTNYQEIDSEIPENLAKDVLKTYQHVCDQVEKYQKTQGTLIFKTYLDNEDEIENALQLPLPQAYIKLLSNLRFDYMDIQENVTKKHHYFSYCSQNQNPPPTKMVRLAQELADLSNALPNESTNSIFVRVDQQRVDLMKALICGAENTPYAHGCYEFDIFCDNNYPKDPPKMNLTTTGNGSIRFNPNLYACGKVCLSLLGTWRGQATENWDPKLSTILQVLLSTQAIIMSEEVYFNEPGFENEAGTVEGEKKNEGYQNIVRYGNIRFAMVEQLQKPCKGFESVIKRHFYLKKEVILTEVYQWLALAEKNEAAYTGLVNDHNYNWANQFKSSKTKYKEMLEAIIKQLETELNKLEKPVDYELQVKQKQQEKRKKKQGIEEGMANLGDIDVKDDNQIKEEKNIDVDDEAVKDRWSRYIGAMGIEAVAKQSAAQIFISGLGGLGAEIAKNIILSGCKRLVLHDYKEIDLLDFSGQFFLNIDEDFNEKKNKFQIMTRAEASLKRIQQLNYYVRCELSEQKKFPESIESLTKAPWNLQNFDIFILTEADYSEIILIDEFCRQNGKKLIVADCYGAFCRVFNDFNKGFEVLDKNGEELQDVMIKSISNEESGIVELLPTSKHKFEDGDEVLFTQIEGMNLLEGMKHEDPQIKSTSINDTIHKVTVINPYKFKIGDTRKYSKYERNGIAKQMKVKVSLNYKGFKESMLTAKEEDIPYDQNLFISDFEKISHNLLSHIAFEAADAFKVKFKKLPEFQSEVDLKEFVTVCTTIGKRYDEKTYSELKDDSIELKYFSRFCKQIRGVFNPLNAFLGGFVAQECIKAITQKFTPNTQAFYYDASEILVEDELFSQIKLKQDRYDGLRIIVGEDLIGKLQNCKLFMVGAGAIGCELLKNYAMLGIGAQQGKIILTDPDIIEVSNLNRQFLFREKHLRQPKSSTAAAAAIYMNKDLKKNMIARLDKVHDGTNHIFTDQFFENLSVVTNALDNVQARRYIDMRCVNAKIPLLESGTLGPKGHVQVILPFKTESYGSMQDPDDNQGEIPHCTLKMFPEETLHCVEWARDLFGKLFDQMPSGTQKVLEEYAQNSNYSPVSQQDQNQLSKSVKFIKKKPASFENCIQYARQKFEKYFNHDIKQLLHVYPLDTKTKDGNLFWSLPKRPPTPINLDPTNKLHCQFIAACACLRATIYNIKIPHDKPRSEEFIQELGKVASKIQVKEFVPNDDKAKEIQQSVSKEEKKGEEDKEEEKKEEEESSNLDFGKILTEFKEIVSKDKTIESKNFVPQIFEKDNDKNYHIDFIYAISNCRATNYKLEPMDWITVKLKAGRIVPALATTTASIAGLQTLELVKLLKLCKKEDHRNIFLNLAVPMMQASEPGDVMKVKLTEKIETNLWDRWEVKNSKQLTLQDFIAYIEKTYEGLEVRDIMKGNQPIYFHAIMNTAGKEKEKEKAMKSKILDIVQADADDIYCDLNITCIMKGDQEAKILVGVPPVRVIF